MIVILDLEGSEAHRVQTALQDLHAQVNCTSSADAIENADKLVLPHCKSMRCMVTQLRDRGIVIPLLHAIDKGKTVLGISNGMHALLDVVYEEEQCTGLGIVNGAAALFDFGEHPVARHFAGPHTGWNQVRSTKECPLLADVPEGEYFYFDHTSHAVPMNPTAVMAHSNHGMDFTAVMAQDRVFGTQFLPERSGQAGAAVFANFLRL